MSAKKLCLHLLLSSLVLVSAQSLAQNLPGSAVEEATVPAEVKTLFDLAALVYPTLFTGASGWRNHAGYTYRFFADSGIYAGVKDGNVHLLGGSYGNTITPKGNVNDVIAALQKVINGNANPPGGSIGVAADFSNIVIAKTLADMTAKFSSLTMEYSTSTGFFKSSVQIRMDLLGKAVVNGIPTDVATITITKGSTPAVVYDMWIDSNGVTRKVMEGTLDYGTRSPTLGADLLGGFTAALATADNTQLQTALANEVRSPTLSSKVTKRLVGNIEAGTIQIDVSADGASLTAYLSDFGSFSMLTQYSSKVSTTEHSFEILDMKLR